MTKAKQSGAFKGHRFPSEIISYAVWAYFRFPMSFRDVEDLLYKRGVNSKGPSHRCKQRLPGSGRAGYSCTVTPQ